MKYIYIYIFKKGMFTKTKAVTLIEQFNKKNEKNKSGFLKKMFTENSKNIYKSNGWENPKNCRGKTKNHINRSNEKGLLRK